MSRPRHDEVDQAERSRRMSDLIAAPVLTYADAALMLDLPLSTLDKLRAEGRGPRLFKIGRRLYVSKASLNDWLRQMAQTEA